MASDRVERRLAAIVAADVAGFSRLVAADEEATLAALRAHRAELVDPKIKEHGGRIANTAGDSVLFSFASAVDAVRCAIAIQRGMAERNDDVPVDRRIEFRVGINVGDVVAEGRDLLGDGVNIAARLEGLAEPGGICLSRTARDQVRDRIEISFEDLGEVEVKNIARPVRVFRMLLEDESPSKARAANEAPAAASLDKPSIAVLAFENMSGDPDQEYFADGIAEDIITALSKFREFVVIARNSSFTYKSRAVDVKQVARELGVRYVLEGSVRRAGNRARITAQLIDAPSGGHVWAERYDRDLEDIFAVQDEITTSIIGSIAPGVVSAEIERAKSKQAAEVGTWDRIMRAHWHIRRFTRNDMAEAIRVLDELLRHQPNNATALGDLALALHFTTAFGWTESPGDAMARMGDVARRAVASDDQDSAVQTVLAIHELFSGRHDQAIRRLARANELNPNSNFARGYLGVVHAFGGDCDPAIENSQAAMRLSPRDLLMVLWHISCAWAYLSAEKFEQAAESPQQAVEWNPDFSDTHGVLAAALASLGRTDEARVALGEYVCRLPGLTLSDQRLERPFRRPADRERFLAGLRAAGLPEA